jgi:hypothetical protein
MRWLLVLMIVFAVCASAADVSGAWKGTADTPMGPSERTFVFKVDGNKLTGETSSQMAGTSTIMDGKVDGDKLTFSITIKIQDQEFKLNYTGKVTGDEIKFHVVSTDGALTLDYNAKRVS